MKIPPALVVVMLLAGVAPRAEADIYVWRDSAGVSHYTNALENVPAEYRQNAITVAKDWARALPPSEAEPATAVAPLSAATSTAAPATTDDPHAQELYSAGYAAGLHAAEAVPEGAGGAVASSSVGPVVQNLQVTNQPEPARERLIPFAGPVMIERRKPTAQASEENKALPPARPAPFLQGPAGPPPVSSR